MTRYDVVLLDADRTLLDFERSEREALRRVLKKWGLPQDDPVYGDYSKINDALWAAFARGEIDQDFLVVERFAALLRLYGASDSPDPARLTRDYMECLGQEAFLLPGAADFCRALNGMGLTLAIATNGLPGPQRGRYVRTGLDKLVPNLEVALTALQVLPRNATAQRLTAYATFMAGAGECGACEDNKKVMHVVFLDNGRTEIARDPLFSQIFRCVRCGACANVFPVFRLVGGHKMGYIYIGAIGLILTYFFHGKDKAKVLCQTCVGCESCKNVCAGGIDLPRLIREIRSRQKAAQGGGVEGALMAAVLTNRKM